MKKPIKKATLGIIPFVDRLPLTEEDWNFSAERVPDLELVPCLLFEFLRESATARQLEQDLIEKQRAIVPPTAAEFQDQWKRDNARLSGCDVNEDPPVPAANVALNKQLEQLHSLRFNINHKLDMTGFISEAVAPYEKPEDLLKTPWQKLLPQTKEILVRYCTRVNKPAFISESEFDTDQLAAAMRENVRIEMEEFKANNQAPGSAVARVRLKDGDKDCMAFLIVVDFGRYDDSAIRMALGGSVTEEIIANRPIDICPQSQSGSGQQRKSEWRGKLNGLGRTRLYCYYDGVGAIKQTNKLAHQWLLTDLQDKGDRAAMKSLADAKARFIRAFHEMLPFEQGKLPWCVANSRFVK